MSSTKAPAFSFHNDYLDVVILLSIVQTVFNIPDHLGTLGIGFFRPVENDSCDWPIFFIDDRF